MGSRRVKGEAEGLRNGRGPDREAEGRREKWKGGGRNIKGEREAER